MLETIDTSEYIEIVRISIFIDNNNNIISLRHNFTELNVLRIVSYARRCVKTWWKRDRALRPPPFRPCTTTSSSWHRTNWVTCVLHVACRHSQFHRPKCYNIVCVCLFVFNWADFNLISWMRIPSLIRNIRFNGGRRRCFPRFSATVCLYIGSHAFAFCIKHNLPSIFRASAHPHARKHIQLSRYHVSHGSQHPRSHFIHRFIRRPTGFSLQCASVCVLACVLQSRAKCLRACASVIFLTYLVRIIIYVRDIREPEHTRD